MDESFYANALSTLASQGLQRRCRLVESVPGAMRCRVDGVEAVNFSSNDYLGLAQDERLSRAAAQAARESGTGAAASRLISGTDARVLALEAAVAAFKGAEAARVFNSGYQANVAILQAVVKRGDWVFADRLNHASLVDGCLLSGARWTRYRHLDLDDLRRRLDRAPAGVVKWIVTDSVFSMDGDYPALDRLMAIAHEYGAFTLVDEAHATGVFGDTRGSGLCEQFDCRPTLQMGTFSKALGGFGAYVAGSRTMMDFLASHARGFIYSTALPPAVLAAAEAGITLVRADASLRERLWTNIAHLSDRLQALGVLNAAARSPIIPLVVGASDAAMTLSAALLARGYYVQAVRPPTVPKGSARLRIAVSAAHTGDQLDGLAAAIGALYPVASGPSARPAG